MAGTTLFPGAIDTNTELNENRVVGDVIPPADHNNLAAAVKATEAAIGKTTSPSAGSLRYLLLHGTVANELLVPNSENVTIASAAAGNNVVVASTTAVLRATPSGSTRDLTGMTGGVAGRMLIIRNVSASQSLVIRNDSASSSVGNRFLLGADVTLAPRQAILVQFDATDNHWDVVASGFGSGGGGTSTAYVHRGTWSALTTYAVNDVVLFDNGTDESSYVALSASTNSQPPNANWQLLARGGTDGTDGLDGDPGPATVGPPGLPGPSRETVIVENASGSMTVDAADGSYRRWTLVGNVDVTPTDTSGVSASMLTFRLYQGGSGANTINWIGVKWVGNGGAPPVLTTVIGELNVVVLEQVEGEWLGYAPGTGEAVEPPPDTYIPLDFELWFQEAQTANQVGIVNYQFQPDSAHAQIGIKRGVAAFVVTTRDDSADPPVPSLTGGGGSSWSMAATQVFGTATVRRRATLFLCRDTSNAAAAPFTVGLAAAGASHTGCTIKVVRTIGLVAPTWLAVAMGSAVTRKFDDATEVSTLARCTLASPQDATDRPLMFIADALGGTMTPGGASTEVGTVLAMTSPTLNIWAIADLTAFDTTMSATIPNGNWGAIAFENEQGGVFVPPPSGPPPISIDTVLAGFDTTDQTADYVTSAGTFTSSIGAGTTVLIGDNRMAICDVINATGTSVDPVQPTLSGGSITTWTMAGTRVFGAGVNRSRITRFIGWQAIAGTATPLTVGVGGQATTGIQIQLGRTGITDSTQKTLAVNSTVVHYYLDAGENASGPAQATLAAARDGASRGYVMFAWNSSLATLGTLVPVSPLVALTSTGMGSAPARQMLSTLTPTGVFDTSPQCNWSSAANLNWVVVGSELGQAV